MTRLVQENSSPVIATDRVRTRVALRRTRRALTISALALSAVATLAVAQTGPRGYLVPGSFDILSVLPAAPRTGDARDKADRAIFRATRALQGTPRWALATNDVRLSASDMMRDFSCAAGVALTPLNAPRTTALVTRALADTASASGGAKTFYKRLRPFQVDRGPTCQPAEQLKGSFDYPSGHTTAGWTWATLLAQLVPDRATPILARGRAFGESRIVCGVHNASAVEAGRVTSAATIAALQSNPEFQADLAGARREMEALRSGPAGTRPDAQACANEAALIAQRVY